MANSMFKIEGDRTTSMDVSVDGRHVPYVASVCWADGTLTIAQGMTASVPGVPIWILPGAVVINDLWVSRFQIVGHDCRVKCNQPARFLLWVDGLVEVPDV